MLSTESVFRLGEQIGTGAFSYVFQAEETSNGHLVALKKSRVSLKVQRTSLHHEARVLRFLEGHPSIPSVFAYGRLEHFEYMAMELLGISLEDIIKEPGKLPLKTVLGIADQMLSALEYIHTLRIVHRDIKPANIMAQTNDPSRLYLIDFGLARPCILGEPNSHDLFEERKALVGTPSWASLNAHHGIDLCPRDDLESLAYVLFSALRGELPWEKCGYGTALGRIAHIREKKHAWPGTRLAEGNPAVFGQLVDYARGLGFSETIEYAQFRAKFESLKESSSLEVVSESHPRDQTKRSRSKRGECPVEVGQLVFVQISAETTIEGHSMQANDPSYWHDPALSSDEWRTSARPAIIIEATFDEWISLYKIVVVSLGRDTPEDGLPVVPLSTFHISANFQGDTDVPQATWPIPDAYCYAFPRATTFYCLPGQSCIIAHWKIDADGVQLLRDKFETSGGGQILGIKEEDPDPDIRYDTRMNVYQTVFFVTLTELGPSNFELPSAANGQQNRGWFDERVKIARRRAWADGPNWTGFVSRENGNELSNSYSEQDYSLWENRQRERDRSLTLHSDQQDLYLLCGKDDLKDIVQVL